MLIDLHTHTRPLSPCSDLNVETLIRESRARGLDGICLTEHNALRDEKTMAALRDRGDFKVFEGMEVTTTAGDILVFGLKGNVKQIVTPEALRREVDACGGVMIAAHPFRGFLVFGFSRLRLTPEEAAKRPLYALVDAVETLNGRVTDRENRLAGQVAELLGKPATGGTDAHTLSEIGRIGTRFDREIRTEKELIEALRSGNYQVEKLA